MLKRRFAGISVLIFLILLASAYANSSDDCSPKNFALFKYNERKNQNLASALYSISGEFRKQNVQVTPRLLAAIMATLEKEVGGENFLPVEENGDYGQGGGCSYKIKGRCRTKPYEGGIDYKGRGYIQITHRENYQKYCGQECVGNSTPEQDVCGCKNQKRCTQADERICPQLKALRPEYAGRIFAAYYLGTKQGNNNLAQLAEQEDYRRIGLKINGGKDYADDFGKRAEKHLQLLESDNKTARLLNCLNASTEYCSGNSSCGPGKECNLTTHACQPVQAPVVPGPKGCQSSYLFSCNDPISVNLKKALPFFKTVLRECAPGFVYGNDRRCHPECGRGIYCTGNSECYNGQCLSCGYGHYLGADGLCYRELPTCNPGYILGEDFLCHAECGNSGTYCIDSQCYNGQCLTCDAGYYLAEDGKCYPENGGQDIFCPAGFIYGEDGYCHAECGNTGTYCIDSQCYKGQCLTCDAGYYLAEDGKCYPDLSCDAGYILGEDFLCHPECGNTGTYCIDSQCYNGQCLTCDPGYYLGTDGKCYPDLSCEPGYILGEDKLCHPECGNTGTYCTGDSTCYMGRCLTCDPGYYLGTDGKCYSDKSCDFGYILGEDGLCHKECGISDTYCTGDSVCYMGRCLTCDPGYYLGTDGKCYSEKSCNPGYILGNDDLCHPECGNTGTYCTGDSTCYNGRCLTCNPGYYLGTDGKCYSEKSCNPGYILGNDDLCHPECGNSGTYCIGGAICYYGRCLTCDPGYYLATDGRCYPY